MKHGRIGKLEFGGGRDSSLGGDLAFYANSPLVCVSIYGPCNHYRFNISVWLMDRIFPTFELTINNKNNNQRPLFQWRRNDHV